ncbi:MAG: hypothetical protein LBD42_00515 [Desulfovibrio sp.]|nr:hypothetical protein [Desulfovibrio sp.]
MDDCNQVAEYANLKYGFMIKDIQERARTHEEKSQALLTELRRALLPLAQKDPPAAAKRFRDALAKNAVDVQKDWERLFALLMEKYNQGFINSPEKIAVPVGYSQEWLRYTDYAKGSVTYTKP